MNHITTADDFPTVIDAMRFHSAEIDRIAELPKEEALREMDKLEALVLSIAARIEREKGGESA
ncbi:hypothetical protein [Aneurinibacillus aneurinilyticus]|uniref:Uncharacterized protein n=1 Tax=Aneurinibacillus aneurinilyticus ATCC 12856 TaxID=649747 RepID=U1WT12_ANEAE|nr:hypothetical protein [Aneurinibacillus aneurinilyticus]ERI05398.1 hypothetical protein HMPREF0083_05681 [Aneurinibacillus aneurinilyticus ATCC 12856]MED0670588.1 hypothetical protein [Aneurinibacillus aneurinilyticus]MED0704893.1 hypothetical protein [Aneurinibacillus aneurinilyticus]MED0724065.1 hypothetical protein [Aneurinibacillus aneurinilyticus]MED0731938.1 hypothetical protein [Aneurinibacillus aneurinilyticus]